MSSLAFPHGPQGYSLGVPVVRIGMTVPDGEELAEHLVCWRQDVCEQVHLQLWLVTLMREQSRRTTLAERPAYNERCDSILEMLDPEPGE